MHLCRIYDQTCPSVCAIFDSIPQVVQLDSQCNVLLFIAVMITIIVLITIIVQHISRI